LISHAKPARRTTDPQSIPDEVKMRSLLLVSAIVAITACSDNQQPTAPVNARRTGRTASGDVTQVGSPTGNPHGDLVGLTQVDFLGGQWNDVDAGKGGGADVQCPAGSVATGGGFEIASLHGTSPAIKLSQRQTLGTITGWVVEMDNSQPGAGQASIMAFVLCAS
jgi:hypothetical protein